MRPRVDSGTTGPRRDRIGLVDMPEICITAALDK
jgi:hypothetical protein